MNRLRAKLDDWTERTARRETPTQPTDDCSHYCLFAPLHYEPGYAYPLLIWLHGDDDDERQLRRVMPAMSLQNYVAAAPRGTARSEGESIGFDWRQEEESIRAADAAVADCLATARLRYNVHDNRVFVAGYLSGGTMALRLALRRPDLFAGGLSLGGPFPSGHAPLAKIDAVRKLPLLIAQGRASREYSAQRACEELRLFHAAGLCVSVRQYPGDGELSTQMLHDVNVWIMERVTGRAE